MNLMSPPSSRSSLFDGEKRLGHAVFSVGARAKGPPDVSQILISSDEEGEEEDEEEDIRHQRLNVGSVEDDDSELGDQVTTTMHMRSLDREQMSLHGYSVENRNLFGGGLPDISMSTFAPAARSQHINSGYLNTESSRVQFLNNNSRKRLKQKKKGFHYSHRIGEQSVTDFFSNYKHLKKSIERDEHLKEPQTAFLLQCEKANLIPIPFGLVNYKGKEDEINVSSYKMGNDYATAFGKGLHLAGNVKKLNFADNRLSEEGSFGIIKGINKGIQEIDLS